MVFSFDSLFIIAITPQIHFDFGEFVFLEEEDANHVAFLGGTKFDTVG